jgi:hypothetical protein
MPIGTHKFPAPINIPAEVGSQNGVQTRRHAGRDTQAPDVHSRILLLLESQGRSTVLRPSSVYTEQCTGSVHMNTNTLALPGCLAQARSGGTRRAPENSQGRSTVLRPSSVMPTAKMRRIVASSAATAACAPRHNQYQSPSIAIECCKDF